MLFICITSSAATLHVGSKRFTESYLLGEILSQSAAASTAVEHLRGLGNTAILFEALKAGSIDLYPEYSGTIDQEILKNPKPTSLAAINRQLAPLGLGAAIGFGFNNTYALAMRPDATTLTTISALRQQPTLRFGLSHEFIGRADGWPGLVERYRLPQQPRGLDHGIAYDALVNHQTDVIDVYSTDAKISALNLRLLQDDLQYFPRYDALVLYRLDIAQRFPAAWQALQNLSGRIDATQMRKMNAAVELEGKSFNAVARAFLHDGGAPAATASSADVHGLWSKLFDGNLWRLTLQHLSLVAAALLAALAIGVPLGALAAFQPRLTQSVMALVGVLQTIPSLALLAMLIPLLGQIGTLPALVALSLYALLPIVRNTCTGLLGVAPGLRCAALALGLSSRDRLLHIDLPLALPVLLAGVKTATVTTIGTATIAAFIGAGGYGERIAIGLALNDNQTLLAGALPAAALALIAQLLFELIERRLRGSIAFK